MAQQRTLVVVADRETAQFHLHLHPGATLEPHGPDIHRPSRGDRNADRPGRAFDSAGQGRHAMEPPTSYQEQERHTMAQEIAKRIERTIDDDEVDRVVLISDPKLLGELRDTLDDTIRDRVVLELDVHLTQATPNEVARRLSEEGTLGLVRAPSVRAGA